MQAGMELSNWKELYTIESSTALPFWITRNVKTKKCGVITYLVVVIRGLGPPYINYLTVSHLNIPSIVGMKEIS